jgi:hypothetical protein
VSAALDHYVAYCHRRGLPARAYCSFGPDTIAELAKLVDRVTVDFPNSVFFATKLVFRNENWMIRQLHNQTALTMQTQLHRKGVPMVILPMNI